MSKPVFWWGIKVHPTPYKKGVMYAEVIPSGASWYRQFLPWVGRWWFEVHTNTETWAYEKGGSGGSYTLRGCMRKAMEAVELLSERGDT